MRHLLCLLLVAVLVPTCSSPETGTATDDVQKSEEAHRAAFRENYAAWRVALPNVPAASIKEFTSLRKRMLLIQDTGITLDWEAGSRWETPDGFRTDSRYRLRDSKGRILASAESMLSLNDLEPGENDNIIQVFRDPTEQSVLVFEEVCWTTSRHILFQPTVHGWSLRYFYLPARPSTNPTIRSEVLGIRDGNIYFKADDEIYQMPIREFPEEKDLGFTCG